MAAVYVSNLVINAGVDFTQTFTLESSFENYPIDLGTHTVESQMRKWSGSSSATTFTCTILEPESAGKIQLSLTPEQTVNLKPGRYIYDVVVTDEFDIKQRVVEGMVLVTEGVTR